MKPGTWILIISLLLPQLAQAGEAERQADFARQELADGEHERALHSAESALRLAPTLYEALGIKALAYEGLGRLELARSLLLAWREVAGLEQLPPPYDEALARLRVELDEQRRGRAERRRGRIVALEPERPVAVEVAAATPEVYRERSQAALRAGQCHTAMAAATELVGLDPGEATGHRLVGDAERCLGHPRRAALAYRRCLDLDPGAGVTDLLADVSAGLASVEVTVALADDALVPLLQLELGDARIDPVARDRASARFEDLPAGRPLLLLVAGRGLRAEQRELEPLGPAEARTLEVAPEVVGLGTLLLGDFGDDVTVTVRTPDEEVTAGPGQRLEVTAGGLAVSVASELGVAEVELSVAPGGEAAFEPGRHLPAGLTVTGVPAGSELRVVVEGRSGVIVERVEQVPPESGAIDPETGLRLAPELRLPSLLGGRGGLWLSHPVLGEAEQDVVLENGAWSGARFDAGQLPGTAAVAARWEERRAAVELIARRQRSASAVTAVLSGLLLGGGAAALGLSQRAADRRVRPGLVCAAPGDWPEACAAAAVLKTQRDALAGSGAVMLGLGAASVSFSVAFGVRSGHVAEPEGWDPWEAE